MKNLLTITFLLIAGLVFAQPVRTTITDDGVNVTVQTPVNIKVIPICDFHWVFVDGQLKMWIEGGNELIPGGRLGNFTINGTTTQQAKLDALGAISAQCAGGGAGGTLTDGNKGDITVSDSGAVWNINAGAIGSTEISNGGVGWVDLAQAVKDSIGVNLGRIFYVAKNGNNATAEVGNPNRPWGDPTVIPALMGNGDIMEFLNPQDTFNMLGGIYIDSLQDITINGNNAVLKLAPSSQTATTLSANYTGGTSISVSSVPVSWQVGDFLRLAKGNDNDNISNASVITNISGTTITVSIAFAIQTGGTFTANSGHNVVEDIKMIYGRPSETENGLTRGSNKRVKIKNIRFDGNRANNTINYSWVIHGAILLHGQGTEITGCDFREFPAEVITGGGWNVNFNTFENNGGSAIHVSVHDVTYYHSSGQHFTNNLVKNCNQISHTISEHNEGNITFSWNGGDLTVSNNTFIDTINTIENSILGVITGARGAANNREKLNFSNNICTGYEKIFFALDGTICAVNVNNNTFDDCGSLVTNVGNLDTVTTLKICNNIAMNGTLITPSSRHLCDPVSTEATSLDDAYNNFSATASKVTIDAAQGQTGGLVWETTSTNIHEHRTGASGLWYLTRWGLASQPTRFNIKATGGNISLAPQEAGQMVNIQTATGVNIVKWTDQIWKFGNGTPDTALAMGYSISGTTAFSGSASSSWKYNFAFDQLGNVSADRYATLWNYGNLNDDRGVGSGVYGLTEYALNLNRSSGGRRYSLHEVSNNTRINITSTGTDTLGYLFWNPTITTTGAGFQNWPIDILSGTSWFRTGTSVHIQGNLFDRTGSSGTTGQVPTRDGTSWTWQTPGGSGTPWVLGAQTLTATSALGSTSAHGVNLTTNGTARIQLDASGGVRSGTITDLVVTASDSIALNSAGPDLQLVSGFARIVDSGGTVRYQVNNSTGATAVTLPDNTATAGNFTIAGGSDLLLFTSTNGAERVSIGGGTAGSTVHLSADTVRIGSTGRIADGTWTPTLTNTLNLDGSTAYVCNFVRVGNTVTVSGRVDANPTATGGVLLEMSLPIASNFTAAENAGGSGAISTNIGVPIYASATNDRLVFAYTATQTSSEPIHFSATYRVQ